MLADVLALHENSALSTLIELLTPFGIQQFDIDNWGAYSRQLDIQQHTIGKSNTQKIERKLLTLHTRIKYLARKTIGFSKSVLMHDTVIGLFIDRYELGWAI
ncbi:MAG: hypothetical protein F6K00_17930 [Leptolyngbya sp. SIOISBB]|nr:hypothetical protein [Leptolyngbya sp. SIOISBB]